MALIGATRRARRTSDFVMRLNDKGEWVEIGDVKFGDHPPQRKFEMTLRKQNVPLSSKADIQSRARPFDQFKPTISATTGTPKAQCTGSASQIVHTRPPHEPSV